MSELLKLLRAHDVEQTHHQLTTGREFVAADRFEGIADGTEVMTLFVGNPEGSGIGVLSAVSFGTGGLAHLDTTNDAAVDTAGTALPHHAKGGGVTMDATVETGGTYTTSGDTLNTILPGTDRAGGPESSAGARAPSDVRLLHPGEGVEYVATNESGGETDYDVEVAIIESER